MIPRRCYLMKQLKRRSGSSSVTIMLNVSLNANFWISGSSKYVATHAVLNADAMIDERIIIKF